MLTFSVSSADSLLGTMVRALVLQLRPGSAFVDGAEPQWRFKDEVRLTLIDTGLWLCVFPEATHYDAIACSLAEGSAGALTIRSGVGEFERGIQALTGDGPPVVSRELLQWLATRAMKLSLDGGVASHPSRTETVRLTGREREVLRFVSTGRSNAEIARELHVSTNTVRSHLRSLASKLEASSRTRIVANARALGFSEVDNTNPRMRSA